jgi:hypothetical protein
MTVAEQEPPVYLIGRCAGGPFDGMVIESPAPTVVVPILRDGFAAANYEFDAKAGVFIWRGPTMEEATR